MALIDQEEAHEKNTTRFLYDIADDPGDAINFNGMLMYQKGSLVCLSKIRGIDVIRITSVPSMEFARDPTDTYEQAVDVTMQKYQRPVETARRNQIANWFPDVGNFIVNSVLVWIPEFGDALEVLDPGTCGFTEDWDHIVPGPANLLAARKKLPESIGRRSYQICTIDRDDVNASERHIRLAQQCNNDLADPGDPHPDLCGAVHEIEAGPTGFWFDVCPNPDCDWTGRPGHLIDGQHRSRGIAESAMPSELLSVNVVDAAYFDAEARSKIFDEVTNTARQLDDLHRLNLAFRREGTVKISRDFDFAGGGSNARSYSVMAKLTNGQPGATLENRIHLLPKHPDHGAARKGRMMNVKDAVIWSSIDYAPYYYEDWWAAGGPWGAGPAVAVGGWGGILTVNQAANSLMLYYEALCGVAWPNTGVRNAPAPAANPNQVVPAGAVMYWETPTHDRNVGRLQRPNDFVQAIFKMYPTVVERIRDARPGARIPLIGEFTAVLSYIADINWNVTTWKNFGMARAPGGQAVIGHLTRILRGLISDVNLTAAGVLAAPMPPPRAPLATINDWLLANPDPCDWIAGYCPGDGPWEGTNLDNPVNWDIRWEVPTPSCRPPTRCNQPPLNAVGGEATIELELDGDIVIEDTTTDMQFVLDLPGYPAGKSGEIRVIYRNWGGEESTLIAPVNS